MVKKILNLSFVFVVAAGISACESNWEILVAAGASRLNGDQAKAHISGNTERWVRHATYYNPDGQVELVWNKVKSTGTWEVLPDGNVCLEIPKWERFCHFYLNDHGAIIMIDRGRNAGAKETVEGRHLGRTYNEK